MSIAILEAKKLGIPTFAIVDTNSDPELVDFPIQLTMMHPNLLQPLLMLSASVKEGLSERKKEKEVQAAAKKDEAKNEEAKSKRQLKLISLRKKKTKAE